MITKENGLKYAKLIHVSVNNGKTGNSNKIYIMEELADGRILCQWGRVGKDMDTTHKPSREWGKIYRDKTSERKGYKDVTDLVVEESTVDTNKSTTVNKVDDIKCVDVKSLFNDLMTFANKSIQRNYKVTQESVTEAQVEAAQNVLTKAVKVVKQGMDIKELNDLLIELYTIIPRKMKDVRDFLMEKSDSKADVDFINNFLANEQDTLDTMAGQVKLLKQQRETSQDDTVDSSVDGEFTILDQIGVKVELETDKKSLDLINKLLGPNANQAKRIFKCVNVKTQGVFDNHFSTAKVKERKLFWHGSRNENWFNIIQTGLMIRPSGAVHTGSMFGDGIYFANKAQKSLGYTSLRGSYWAGGSANKGYLALYDVHIGDPKHIHKHDSSCYRLSKSVLDAEGKDSVYAHGGIDLRNDEFIVYDGKQCTIAYLIEMG
jgi:poly [ADP-ribose] polymerase